MTELTPDLSESMELLDTFQIEELTQQLEKRIESNPKDLRSLLMLGSGYYLRGKISKAIQIYQRAIKVSPQLPYAYYYLGVSYYRQARLNDAVNTFKKVLDLAPHFLMAYYWLGIANWHKGDYHQARLAFEKLLSENDESPIAHYHAALACIEEQAFECALQHLEALAGIVQDDSRVQLYLGQVFYRLNRIDEAIAAYKKGLQLSPNDYKIKEALKYLTEVPEP